MHAHYLQHVPFEGLGSIESWLRDNKYTTSCSRLFQSTDLPDPDDVDLLIVLGGPMSVNDETDYPWLKLEKEFVRRMIRHEKRVLGICLGAQLIASATGAAVYPNGEKEIGWFPIKKAANAVADTFHFPDSAEVFHWHGETFDLPEGAVLLAQSDACVHQAFQLGKYVIGLQFHLETTPMSQKDIIRYSRDELMKAPFIQSEDAMNSTPELKYTAINNLMNEVLDYLTR
jgi:GMP synthase-like glutamine amidotransferase